MTTSNKSLMSRRFRGFYPVVIDIETGGLEPRTDAMLEIAAISLTIDDANGLFKPQDKFHHHVQPFAGSKIKEDSLAITGIDPHHPFRFAVPENQAIAELIDFVTKAKNATGCQRVVLVGHNAWFDLAFLNAAMQRTKVTKNPFHKFTVLDTASLAALVYGQTVLAQALKTADIEFDQAKSHSAIYDAEKTAELFCKMVNEQQFSY